MRSHTTSKLRSACVGIETLEQRRLLSTVNAFRDPVMDNDLVPDLLITGDTGGDLVNNVDIYIDYENHRTIVHDDINNIGIVNPSELYIYNTLFETIDVVARGSDDKVRVYFVSDFGCEQTYDPPGSTYSPFSGLTYEEAALSIYGDLGAGNDTFLLTTLLAGVTPNGAANLSVNTPTPIVPNVPIAPGDPNNQSTFDPDGADLCCADLVVEVDGGTGNDNINYDFSRISIKGSYLTLNADGQDNNDTITLSTPSRDPNNDNNTEDGEYGIVGDICCNERDQNGTTEDLTEQLVPIFLTPSIVDVNFATGGGTNTVNINAKSNVGDDSDVDIEVEGGSGADTVNAGINLDIQKGAQWRVDANLFGGNDKLAAKYDFSADGIESGEGTLIHLGATGGDGTDTLEATHLEAPGETSTLLAGAFDFDFKGGNGNDKVNVQLDSAVQQADSILRFVGGASMRVYLNGDAGNDFCEFDAQIQGILAAPFAEVTVITGPPLLDVAVMGGSGDDKLVLAVNNVGTLPFSYPASRKYMLIDGGSGTDIWDQDGFGTSFTTRGVERQDDNLETNELPI